MTIRYEIGEDFAVYGRFTTGHTITCALFNGLTGASIAVTNTTVEIGTTGIYRFNSSNITTAFTSATHVVWQMTDSATGLRDEGSFVVGGGPSDKLTEVWRDRGLDASNPKTITENTVGEDYDEDMTGIHKDVIKSGGTTTITRV